MVEGIADPEAWGFPSTGNTSIDSSYVSLVWVSSKYFSDNGHGLNKYLTQNSTIEAHACIFSTAMHEISARVENAIYSETILRENVILDQTVFPNITQYLYTTSCESVFWQGACRPDAVHTKRVYINTTDGINFIS